ncbi:MAG: hypothetical protein EON87_06525 [Brevundimonas sp.]|nr:MAG: hypothetical protein EON87_06525 [Brevundimonas sp.]
MIALLAAAAVAVTPAAQTDYTAEDMGRASIFAGMCSTIGWVSSRDQVLGQAQAYATRHPDQSDQQIAAAMTVGTDAAKAEIEAAIAAFRADRDGAPLKAYLRRMCDQVATDMPAFLSRQADTDQRFEARMTEVLGSL